MLPWVKVQTVGINMYQINYLLKALKEKEQVLEVCSFIDFIFYAVFFFMFYCNNKIRKKKLCIFKLFNENGHNFF